MRFCVWSLIFSWVGLVVMSCVPPEPPAPENPPCLLGLIPAPKAGTTLKRENLIFKVTFSKLIEPGTLSVADDKATVYLISGELDSTFLSDMESPPLADSRKSRAVKLSLVTKEVGSGSKKRTELTIRALEVLQGDSTYYLVITRKVRDKLIALSEGRFSGSRPLNFCPDKEGIWRGSLTEFKAGRTERFEFRTEPAPPKTGSPKIVEVMVSPKSDIKGGEYVEIINAPGNGTLDLCGFVLSKDPNNAAAGRKIVPFDENGKCRPLKEGERAVVIEPDYNKAGNPYQIPSGTALYTTVLSSGNRSTTLLSGNIGSGDSIVLFDEGNRVEWINPQLVAGGGWPDAAKSLEKCKVDGPNDATNWKVSKTGTPGKSPNATCP